MNTEEQIRQWVRDERNKIVLEEQASCFHRTGTWANNVVTCEKCGRNMTKDDWGSGALK